MRTEILLDEDQPGSARIRPAAEPACGQFVAAEEAEAGMVQKRKVYDETGRELYMGAGDGEKEGVCHA